MTEVKDPSFNFSGFVEDLILSALEHNEEVKDVLTVVAEEVVEDLVDSRLEDLSLVKKDEFDELADRVIASQEDLDSLTDTSEDLQERLDALEKDSIYEEDFQSLEQDHIRLEKLFKQYLPLLEALDRATPYLKLLGLIKDEDNPHHYQQHPKAKSPNDGYYAAPSINWMS